MIQKLELGHRCHVGNIRIWPLLNHESIVELLSREQKLDLESLADLRNSRKYNPVSALSGGRPGLLKHSVWQCHRVNTCCNQPTEVKWVP